MTTRAPAVLKRFLTDLRGNHISSNLWLYARLYHGAQVNHFTHIHQGAELQEVLSFFLNPMQTCFLILLQTRDPEKEKRSGQRPEELNHYDRLRAIRGVPFGVGNYASHFICVEIF